MQQDSMPQYFFQFNYSQNSSAITHTQLNLAEEVGANLTKTAKIVLFPVAANSILVRIENIGDLFDANGQNYS
jgi:hypothetical protein